MKRVACIVLACWAAAQFGYAEELWMTDFAKAQAKAKEEKKLMLMDFNGSDWCPPCKVLKTKVLSSPEFIDFAKKNLVLVDVDFPQLKKQTEEQKKANEQLSEKYGVRGFPTLVVLDSAGKELKKETGYNGETPKDLIEQLAKLKSKE